MKPKRKTLVAALLAVLTVSGVLLPLAASHRLNDLFFIPRPSDQRPPDTGLNPLDEALDDAFEILDAAADEGNERLYPMRAQPEVPATFFGDSFEPDPSLHPSRLWQRPTPASLSWRLEEEAAIDGNVGYWFWDAVTGHYPLPGPSAPGTSHHFLVSPRISLRSLPVDADPLDATDNNALDRELAGSAANAPQTGGVADPHQIMLYFRHRFHFADGLDGGRLEIYLNKPTTNSLGAPGKFEALQPTATAGRIATTAAFSNLAFTGAQGAPREEAYDVTRFAGQDVWFVFHAAVLPTNQPSTYFSDPALFDASVSAQGLFGWMVDAVHIDGPAYVHNVRVDEVLYPFFPDAADLTGRTFFAASGAGQPRFSALFLNRGQVDEQVRPSLELARFGQTTGTCTPLREEVLLHPGHPKAVEFTCPPLEEGADYVATFAAPLAATNPDLYPKDNQLAANIHARRGTDVRLVEPPSLTPRLEGPTIQRALQLKLSNAGFGTEAVEVQLQVMLKQTGTEGDQWEDVTNDTSRVLFAGNGPHWKRTATIPADPAGIANRYDLVWNFLLREAGEYQARIQTYASGALMFSTSASAATLVAQGAAYKSGFAGEDEVLDIVVGSSEWTTQSVAEPRPPCVDSRCPDTVLELFRIQNPALATGVNPLLPTPAPHYANLILRGEPDPSTLPAERQFTQLRVRVQQFMDLRCPGNQPSCNPANGVDTIGPSTIRLNGFSTPRINSAQPGQPAVGVGSEPFTLQQVFWRPAGSTGFDRTDATNRFAYLAQWTDEEYVVPLALPQAGMTSRPGSALATFNLEFSLQVGNTAHASCPFVTPTIYCPVWRVARAIVEAVDTDGNSVVILQTTGIDDEQVGQWKSYFAAVSPFFKDSFAACAPVPKPPATASPTPTPSPMPTPPSAEKLTAHAENDGRCPMWKKRPVSEFATAESSWREFDSVPQYPAADGVWTVSDPTTKQYNDPHRDLLVSPALLIPEDAGDPILRFQHSFDFRALRGAQNWQNFPSYQDGGMLLMRYMRNDGGIPVATTPFLPIAIRYNHAVTSPDQAQFPNIVVEAALPAQAHKFVGSDCTFYPQHPVANCATFDLINRPLVTHEIPLARLPVMDFSRARPAMAATTVPSDTLAKADLMAIGIVDASLPAPQRRLVDLRSDCDGPCLVQFAFRFDSIDPVVQQGLGAQYPAIDLTPAKRQDHQAKDGKGEGWFIGDFQIIKEQAVAHDLRVRSATLETDYLWPALGLGPATEATLVLDVCNDGLFIEDHAVLSVQLQNAATDAVTLLQDETPSDFSIGRGECQDVRLPFVLPEDAGNYRILAGVHLTGELKPGLPLADEDPTDNEVAFRADGTTIAGVSSVESAPLVPIRPNPRLRVELAVSPLAGRADFPRIIDIRIRNEGNVPVIDAKLVRAIRPFSGGAADVEAWIVARSPPPGASAGWEELELDHDPKVVSVFGEPDQYVVTASVEVGDRFDFQEIVVDAFQNFYSDVFEGGPTDEQKLGFVEGSGLKADHGDWAIITGENFGAGTKAWHLGDLGRGTLTDATLASLTLPRVDLSTASRALLSFAHRYDFERAYDGARVEVSLNDGGDWVPMEPRRGYDDELLADTLFNPTHDPTVPIRAFTGNSLARSPATEGWVVEEFDLGQVAGLTTPVLVQRFDQEGFTNDLRPREAFPNDRVRYSTTWSLPGRDCLRGCWYRENLNHHQPVANPAGEAATHPLNDAQYWWSRNAQGVVSLFKPITTLPLEVQIPALASDEQARIEFWQWKDAAGAPSYRVRAGGLPIPVSAVPAGDQRADGWRLYHIPLTSFQDQTVTIEWIFTEDVPTAADAPNRGLVIDDVRLHRYRVERSGAETEIAQAAFPTASSAWQRPLISVSVGGSTSPFCSVFPALCDSFGVPQFGWTSVDRVPDTPDAWKIERQATRSGEIGSVWWMGDFSPLDNRYHYPANARELLATPTISLKELGGTRANLTFWEHYHVASSDIRQVLVQVAQPTPTGERLGPWTVVETFPASAANSVGCVDTGAWCPHVVDISSYVGMEVRFAFQLASTRRDLAIAGGDTTIGYHWGLDEVGIQGESFAGRPVLLRFRSATDGSIDEGGWSIDNLQLVGLLYDENAAILPKETRTELVLAPGTELDLGGVVRNLGPNLARNLLVSAQVTPLTQVSPTDVDVEFLDLDPRVDVPTGDGPVGPFSLAPAGAKTVGGEPSDRVPYGVHVRFPTEGPVENAKYRIEITLLEKDPVTGAIRRFADDNLGDHERTFRVTLQTRTQIDVVERVIDPMTTTTGTPTTIQIGLRNSGTKTVQPATTINITSMATGEVVSLEAPAAALVAGSSSLIDVEWPAAGAGLHRVTAWINGIPDEFVVGHILVDQIPLFFQDDLEGDPAARGWVASRAGQYTTCGVTTEPNSDLWRTIAGYGIDASTAYHMGVTGEEAFQGITYRNRMDSSLRTPSVDLTALADVATLTDSPFHPYLSFRYRSLLGPNDGVIVQTARNVDTDSYWIDGPDYTGSLACPNPLAGTVVRPIPSPAGQRRAFMGNDDAWRVAEFPLGGRIINLGGGVQEPVLGNDATFAFRFGSDQDAGGIGFTIDDVSVSAYSGNVEPAQQAVTLQTGSNKTYFFRFENTGAAADTYQVRVDPVLSSFPGFFQVEVLNPTLHLDSGEAGLVSVRVTIANARSLPPVQQRLIVLEVASQTDPNRIEHARILVEQFQPARLADLNLKLSLPSGADESVVEGDATSFLASIENVGLRPSRATSVVLFACPSTGNVGADIGACRDQLQSGGPGRPRMIGTAQVPALPSIADVGVANRERARFSTTFTWIPPLLARGAYHVVAVVDAEELVRQFDRANDLSLLPFRVDPLERPDVRIKPDSLQVLDEGGRPTHFAHAGEVLELVGIVENGGNADALGVTVRLVNQFPLAEHRVPIMAPGQEIVVKTRWVAQPGNWVVLLEGVTSSPELQRDNNAETWALGVQRGSVQLAFEKTLQHAGAGAALPVALALSNQRGSVLEGYFEVDAPQGVALLGLPTSVAIPRGFVDRYEAQLAVSTLAEPGSYTIDVRLRGAPNLPPTAATQLRVQVDAQRLITLTHEPIQAAPGSGEGTFEVTNLGSARELLNLTIEPPAGWTADILAPRSEASPAETVSFAITFTSPHQAPPSVAQFQVRNEGASIGTLQVRILPAAAWATRLEQVAYAEGLVTATLRIENVGNVASVPPLADEAFGVPINLHPAAGVLAPGHSQVFQVTIPSSGKGTVQVPGLGIELPLADTRAPAQLEAVRWELRPQAARSGETVTALFEVRNAGATPRDDVAVRFYVDGRLVEERRTSLGAHEVQQVNFTWRAAEGDHVAAVTIGEEQAVERAVVLQVGSAPVSLPTLGFAPMVLLVLLGVCVTRRMRRT